MNEPKDAVKQLWALTYRLNSVLLWCSNPEYVKLNRVALIGALNKLFNEVCYLSDLLSPPDNKTMQIERLNYVRISRLSNTDQLK